MENDEAISPRVKDGIELTWVSHKTRFTEGEYGWVRIILAIGFLFF